MFFLLLCIHACTYISTVLNSIDIIDMLKAGRVDGDGKTKKAEKVKVRHDCNDGTV